MVSLAKCKCGCIPTDLIEYDDADVVLGCNHCVKMRKGMTGKCPHCESEIDDSTKVYVKDNKVIGCGECTLRIDPFWVSVAVWDKESGDEFY